MILFEWDETKNEKNQKKHGVAFEDAKTVFYDDHAILFDDPEHSVDEERFLIIGLAENNGICIISHCYRESADIIRIISARRATKKEKATYQENLK